MARDPDGAYYDDGCWVWQGSRFGWDNSGYHFCGKSSGLGYSVDVVSCYKYGDPSTSSMTLGDRFTVSVIASGFPFHYTHEMAVCPDPHGDIPTCVWN